MTINRQIKSHLVKDIRLKPYVEAIDLPHLSFGDNIFKELIESIISQQLSTKVAQVITKRFHDLVGNDDPTPEMVLALDHEAKRSVGLSNNKASYIHNIAEFWLANNLIYHNWKDMDDEEIISLLTQIKGVGKWTAQMILMFPLERQNVFPYDDLGIKQGMIQLYDLKSTGKELIAEMHDIAEKWSPYRSIACRYIWRAKDAKVQI